MVVINSMKPYAPVTKNQAIALRSEGNSIPSISHLLGTSATTVARWTKEIKPSRSCHHQYKIDSIQHDYFSQTNLNSHPERFVIVGFIAADGCIYIPKAGQNRLQFNLASKDKCVLEYFNNEICNGTRNLSFIKGTNSYIFYIPSDKICSDLSKFNIVPRKTAIYDLPELQKDAMKYFIRGYYYGDGCCYQRGRESMYHFVGTNKFCQNLKNYLIENSILDTCGLYAIKGRPNYSQIHIKGRIQTRKFADYIMSDDKTILLPRKHIRLHQLQ